MATTRIRKTFHYPADSDSDDPLDLDEEHQETLLSDLKTQDEATSTLYRHLFLALPVLTSIGYIPSLFKATTAAALLAGILSIAVPALAAYTLYYHPITLPGSHGLQLLYSRSGNSTAPHERVLIILGATLAGVLAISAAGTWWQSSNGENDAWGFLPAAVYFLTLFVRQQLAPVDLEELRKARYELKGA